MKNMTARQLRYSLGVCALCSINFKITKHKKILYYFITLYVDLVVVG